jgi:hypothetical protein
MPRAGQLLPGSWITTLFTVMIVPMARPTRSHSHHRRSYIVATRSTGVVPRSSPTRALRCAPTSSTTRRTVTWSLAASGPATLRTDGFE